MTENWTTETWTYGGTRVGKDNKPVSVWIDGTGEELWFKADTRKSVGALYDVEVWRKSDGGISRRAPSYAGLNPDEALRQRLWTAHDVARAVIARARQEAKDGRANALDEALAPLLALARQQRTGADRDAFVATVLRRLLNAR